MYPFINLTTQNFQISNKKLMAIFYIIDCSGSMKGERIGTVNRAIQETLSFDLSELQKKYEKEMYLKIGILAFNNDCYWITQGLISPDKLHWKDLIAIERSFSSMGLAFQELNDKMCVGKLLPPEIYCFRPSIILISDGAPTDDWKAGLKKLRSNPAYIYGNKVAIAIGDDADIEVLAQFTENKDAVFKVKDKDDLYRMIEKNSITSVGSTSISGNQYSNNKNFYTEQNVNEENDSDWVF